MDKEAGLLGSVKSIFQPKTRLIKAVTDISFSVEEGEMIGFIGQNGAGKTTTLKMLSGILHPSGGKIEVLGFAPFERKEAFLKKVSLVMGQKNQLIWDLPAIDSFNLIKETYDVPNVDYQKTLDELVEIFGVSEVLQQQVRRLSLGQRMKCELIASLLYQPQILFLDEPTIGLDVVVQKKLRQFVKDINRKYGTTVILTSHYMDDVKEIASRIVIINRGSLVFDDSLDALSKKYANYKSLKVVLNKEANQKQLTDLGEGVEYNYPYLFLKVKPANIAEVTGRILRRFDVDDIDISEPELEDIVANLFAE